MVTQLPTLPQVERLSPRVIRILGGNPGKFTLQGTNTYLIGIGPRRILLDTAEGHDSYTAYLKGVLESEKCSIDHVILSHWHMDHIKGVSAVSTMTTTRPPIYKHKPNFLGWGKEIWKHFEHGHLFSIGEGQDKSTLRAVFSPGHTPDHMTFVLEEEEALFTADAILGHGTAVFDDLGAYMSTLSSFLRLSRFNGRAYPGHGAVIEDGPAKVKEYIEHRMVRENQVFDVLKNDKGREWASMDIVKIVYREVPETLHAPAEGGVKQILGKLANDGKILESNGKWTFRESKI